MTSIYFLASSKPFQLSKEIIDYQKNEIYDYSMYFSISEVWEGWYEIMKPLLSMPYLYEVRGLENDAFFMYLEKQMEIGDLIELYYMHHQDWHESYIKRAIESPEPITINVGRLTYVNQYGTYQLNAKNWIEELRHRTLVTDRGVTTIVKY
ncbi:MAG: hypothetical protein ABS882_07570 [Lysinibacillus sp.]